MGDFIFRARPAKKHPVYRLRKNRAQQHETISRTPTVHDEPMSALCATPCRTPPPLGTPDNTRHSTVLLVLTVLTI